MWGLHCKKVIDFPVLSRDVTNQTLPGQEKFNYSRPGRVWLVTSRLGTGKSIIFFTVWALVTDVATCGVAFPLFPCALPILSMRMVWFWWGQHSSQGFYITFHPSTLGNRNSARCAGTVSKSCSAIFSSSTVHPWHPFSGILDDI